MVIVAAAPSSSAPPTGVNTNCRVTPFVVMAAVSPSAGPMIVQSGHASTLPTLVTSCSPPMESAETAGKPSSKKSTGSSGFHSKVTGSAARNSPPGQVRVTTTTSSRMPAPGSPSKPLA
ncbi:hypothetical protein D0Q02_07660 [Micromonospora craniellae]|uniref:Uncharacterized protein n=1 Tax=Micromonospora craniellae TaxID=2294034 RepID=A0A372G2N2_9ACTN|nr:hypothetical protein D0Q02_07660 [Micromonospora craniellae]